MVASKKHLCWKYIPIVPDLLYLGIIDFSAAPKTKHTCEDLSYVADVITESCKYIHKGFMDVCKENPTDGSDNYFVGLYFKASTIRPEDTIELGYPSTAGRGVLKRTGFATLEEYFKHVNAPIVHNMIGLTFMFGSVRKVNMSKLTSKVKTAIKTKTAASKIFGYFDLKFLAACPVVNRKYGADIAKVRDAYVATGSPRASAMMPLSMISEFEHYATRQYSRNKPKDKRVLLMFTILETAADAYFYYIEKGGFYVVDNQLLSCEMFNYKKVNRKTDEYKDVVMVHPTANIKAHVHLPCDNSAHLPLLYRPLNKLKETLPKPTQMEYERLKKI